VQVMTAAQMSEGPAAHVAADKPTKD
jgi:hypothetical protein